MEDFTSLLFTRVFLIVGGMLAITGLVAYFTQNIKQSMNGCLMFIAMFVILMITYSVMSIFPLNLVMVGVFSAFMGYSIGPAIGAMGKNYTLKKMLLEKGYSPEEIKRMHPSEKNKLYAQILAQNPILEQSSDEWKGVVAKAMLGTALAVISTAAAVFYFGIDFNFMGVFLFVALFLLIIFGIITMFTKSKKIYMIYCYLGAIIFVGYLLYDFSRLSSLSTGRYAGTWEAAISMAIQLYLDIINLFMFLLQIFNNN